MNTKRRIALLARAHPKLFPQRELFRLVKTQLGAIDALDRWMVRDGIRVRARTPRVIHHVCAGNLAVSAISSIAHGLILGSNNTVKLPGPRDDNETRREIIAFVHALPKALRSLVELHAVREESAFVQADVIVAFGNDATMTTLRARARVNQRFIAHGHAVSLLWLANPNGLTPKQARACAIDILTYDQLGCLSPQAIYFPSGINVELLGAKLARALESEWKWMTRRPGRPLGTRARIAEARDAALALGHRIWLPASGHLGWTLIHDPNPTFSPSPLHGVIFLRQAASAKLPVCLQPVRGKISTIGVAGKIDDRTRDLFLDLGVTRFCAAGRMQFPPLGWHHDGRPALADLVTWIDDEGV